MLDMILKLAIVEVFGADKAALTKIPLFWYLVL